jgi:hypothetical protein
MPTEPKEIEPLMSSIEEVLAAIDTESPSLAAAVEQLRNQYNEIAECCCRRAHVIPFNPEARTAK